MSQREKIREIRNNILDNRYFSNFVSLIFGKEIYNHVPSTLIDSLMNQKLTLTEGGEKHLSQFLNHVSDRREKFISFRDKNYPEVKSKAEEIMKLLVEEYHLE